MSRSRFPSKSRSVSCLKAPLLHKQKQRQFVTETPRHFLLGLTSRQHRAKKRYSLADPLKTYNTVYGTVNAAALVHRYSYWCGAHLNAVAKDCGSSSKPSFFTLSALPAVLVGSVYITVPPVAEILVPELPSQAEQRCSLLPQLCLAVSPKLQSTVVCSRLVLSGSGTRQKALSVPKCHKFLFSQHKRIRGGRSSSHWGAAQAGSLAACSCMVQKSSSREDHKPHSQALSTNRRCF